MFWTTLLDAGVLVPSSERKSALWPDPFGINMNKQAQEVDKRDSCYQSPEHGCTGRERGQGCDTGGHAIVTTKARGGT